MLIISNSNPFLQTTLPNGRSHASARFVVFYMFYILNAFYCICVCISGPNLLPKRNGLWAILAIRVCTDQHLKKSTWNSGPSRDFWHTIFNILCFETHLLWFHILFRMDSMNIGMQRKSLKCLYKQIIIIIILVLFYLLELNKNRSEVIWLWELD